MKTFERIYSWIIRIIVIAIGLSVLIMVLFIVYLLFYGPWP